MKKTIGEFSIHREGLRHTHILRYIQACTRTDCANTVVYILHGHLCTPKNMHHTDTDRNDVYGHADAHRQTHTHTHTCPMNVLQPGTEEREEGAGAAKEQVKQKRKTERKVS